MAVQRQVDLAGTLLSPDQAQVSAEAAGVVRQVLVEIGREVRVGDPLVRLEPRSWRWRWRAPRARCGRPAPSSACPIRRPRTMRRRPTTRSGRCSNALANRDDARASAERAKTLAARGLISPVDLQTADTRLKVAEAAYQSAVDTVRGQKALLQDRRASYDLAVKKLDDAVGPRADRRRRVGASGPGRRVHRASARRSRPSSRSIR